MHAWVKPALFAACLLPFLWLLNGALTGGLGPDPAEAIMHVTGEWGLRLLALTLLMSLLRKWLGRPWPLRLRRMLGLFAFFYACVHLASFSHFYIGWTGAILLEELAERPYITVGFLAWLLMLPLAITSTREMQRKLGRNWLRLHRLVYPAAVLCCIHLVWQIRSDAAEALVYSLVFALLLAWRLKTRVFPVGARSTGDSESPVERAPTGLDSSHYQPPCKNPEIFFQKPLRGKDRSV